MRSYAIATIVLLAFSLIDAKITCQTCFQQLKVNSSNILNFTDSACPMTSADGDFCTSLLMIDFTDGSVTINFADLPSNSLVFSNGNKLLTNTTTIWLSKDQVTLALQTICANSSECVEDISRTFYALKQLKYGELREKLRQHLFYSPSLVPNLTCADHYGNTVACPNGFCQLTATDNNEVNRKCVRSGSTPNPYGLIISSLSMGPTDGTSFTYSCNKPMCNDDATVMKVQTILKEYGFLSFDESPVAALTTTPVGPNPQATTTSGTSAISLATDLLLGMPLLFLRFFS